MCTESLNRYCNTGDIEHWREFKSNTRIAKKEFFDNKIYEIASSNKRPWDLMNWVKKKNLPTKNPSYTKANHAILYQTCGTPYTCPTIQPRTDL